MNLPMRGSSEPKATVARPRRATEPYRLAARSGARPAHEGAIAAMRAVVADVDEDA